jgi:phospholipid/cholesterol/gamma-HCH transport system substrate-binding protein
MKEKYAQTKVGVIVFLALAILIFTILWGKSISITRNHFRAQIFFANVVGLETGARVLVNGIPKGKVEAFELRNDGVIVKVSLEKDVKLQSDAFAYIEAPDLMAERVVSVVPGNSGHPFDIKQAIPGQASVGYNQLFVSFAEISGHLISTLDEIQNTSVAIRNLLQDENLSANLNNSVRDLSLASNTLRAFVQLNQPKLESSLNNVSAISEQVSLILSANNGKISGLFSDLSALSNELRVLTNTTQELSIKLKNQEGSLGKLLYRDDLYQDMRRVTANLDSLVNEIRNKGLKTHIKIF